MVATSKQVTQLLIDKHFELAIRLCNLSSGENIQQKSDKIREIQTLFAFDQVNQFSLDIISISVPIGM